MLKINKATKKNKKTVLSNFENLKNNEDIKPKLNLSVDELIEVNKKLILENLEKQKQIEILKITNEELSLKNLQQKNISLELLISNNEVKKLNKLLNKTNEFLKYEADNCTYELNLINENSVDYKFALDEASIVSIIDAKGKILYVNDNFCKISKYTKDELIGKDHSLFNSDYYSLSNYKDFWSVISKGNIWKSEVKNKAKDNTFFWGDVTVVPFLDKTGKPYKYLSIIFDITDCKYAYDKLAISESKFKNLYDNAIVSMFTLESKTLKAIDVNDNGVKMFGYKDKNDFINNFYQLNHFFELDAKNKKILHKKGILNNLKVEINKNDGTLFWGNINLQLSPDKNKIQFVVLDITEQVIKQKQLEISEENYRLLYGNSITAMFTIDLSNNKVINSNNICLKLFGYKSKDEMIERFDTRIHFFSIDERDKYRKEVFDKGSVSCVVKMKKANGKPFWANLFAKINSDKKNIHFVINDITRQLTSLLDLKVSEEKYKKLYDNNLVAFFTIENDSYKVIDVNTVGVSFFGYDSKKHFVDCFLPSIHYVNKKDRKENIFKLEKDDEVNNVLQEMKRLNGEKFWANIFIKKNALDNTTQTVMIDVSLQVNSLNNLKVSEENYRDLFENSIVSIFTFDINTNLIKEVNDIGIKIYGYKSKKSFLDSFDISKHINDRDREKFRKILLEKGEVKNRVIELKKLDGTLFFANIFMKLNSDRNLVQIAIIDVTEQMFYHKDLELKIKDRTRELSESLERERHLNDLKSRFVTNASHEFRTPLSSILSSASLIEMYNQTDQQELRNKHVNRIYSSVNNLTDILNDYLSIAALENTNIKVEIEDVNLPLFLDSLVDEMEGMTLKKGQKIKFEHKGDVQVKLAKKELRVVVLNLLSNSSKYSDNGKDIILTSSLTNNQLLISVKDFGIGIPNDDKKNLFSQFFRAKNVENIQGTGLGLSIANKSIELIGGTISFTSELNKGTTFTIKLPPFKNNTILNA